MSLLQTIRSESLRAAAFLEHLPESFDHRLRQAAAGEHSTLTPEFHGFSLASQGFFTNLQHFIDRRFNENHPIREFLTAPFQIPLAVALESFQLSIGAASGIAEALINAGVHVYHGRGGEALMSPVRFLATGAVGAVAHFVSLYPSAIAFAVGRISGEEHRRLTPYLAAQSATHAAFSGAMAAGAVMGIRSAGARVARYGNVAASAIGDLSRWTAGVANELWNKMPVVTLDRPMAVAGGPGLVMMAGDDAGSGGSARARSTAASEALAAAEALESLAGEIVQGMMDADQRTSIGELRHLSEATETLAPGEAPRFTYLKSVKAGIVKAMMQGDINLIPERFRSSVARFAGGHPVTIDLCEAVMTYLTNTYHLPI